MSLQQVHARKYLCICICGPRSLSGGALLNIQRVRCRRKTTVLGLPRFQNLLLIVYDHINTICAIIQRLFRQIKLL